MWRQSELIDALLRYVWKGVHREHVNMLMHLFDTVLPVQPSTAYVRDQLTLITLLPEKTISTIQRSVAE
jgi:hypothetical protein